VGKIKSPEIVMYRRIVPPRLFLFRARNSIDTMLDSVTGRFPFSRLKDTSKYLNTLNAPISVGMLLLNRLLVKQSSVRLVRKPICEGRDDVNE
jgi:hypothetical protein